MEKIDEQLNNISLVEIPFGIHQSIMRKINYQRIKPVLFVSLILLLINFIVIVWRINAKLIDAEFLNMSQDFFKIFNFNFYFINTILGNFFEIVSPILFTSAILNFVGAVYIGKKIKNTYQFSRI